jgi:alcohol dehydrogenase
MKQPEAKLPGELAFDHHPRTRIVFGVNSVERAGELAREYGARKVLLVTDAGLVKAGHAQRVQSILQSAGVAVAIHDAAHENPTTQDVARCVETARRNEIDFIVGLGGGSSMDTAKGCNFILTNGGDMKDYWGVGKAAKPMLPLIAIPTTAGTGSECQSAALITDEVTHQKMACLDPKAAARVAILDPALTVSQPPRVAACTGLDAIAHAVESAVTRKRNPVSLMFAREAFRLCFEAFPLVMQQPQDLEARGRMLLGAAYAGCAIENSMLGAAHAAANPLTAHHDVVHGEAVGLMLPHVVRFNAARPEARQAYADLAAAAGIAGPGDDPPRAVDLLVARLERLLNAAGIARSLKQLGVEESDLPTLADEAARQWTASFNPRPAGREDLEGLYAAAFVPRGEGDAAA